jgi:hypothetical protein
MAAKATAANALAPANAALRRHERGADQKNRPELLALRSVASSRPTTARLNQLGLVTAPPCQESSAILASRPVPLAVPEEVTIMGKHDDQVSF